MKILIDFAVVAPAGCSGSCEAKTRKPQPTPGPQAATAKHPGPVQEPDGSLRNLLENPGIPYGKRIKHF